MQRFLKGLRTVLVGIIINMLLAAIKIISGIIGNSYALIADGIESTTDIFSSLVVWGGLKIASKPADDNHPYGHGKAESLSAIVVSMALLMAALIICIQSVREIITPHHAPASFTLFILVGVIVTKELLFRFVLDVSKEINSTSMKVDAWHHRSDAITSAAAFVGILIALLGGEGYESADDFAALLASCIIGFNGVRLFKTAMHDIMDTAASTEFENRIRNISKSTEGVLDIEKCFIRKSGLNYIVDIHVIVNGNLSVYEGHEIGHRLKDKLCTSNLSISNVMVHIEPGSANL
ncbi:MAG: cation transporter [Ignavibacteriales bacterium]|nr:MAG: cation transporter [Ignavibacteriales bacterium]